MKKLVLLGLLILAWIYGSGYWAFRETSVNSLLNDWDAASAKGDAETVCGTFADDMTFSLEEHSADDSSTRQGGKEELCAYLRKLAPVMARAITSTNVSRDNLTVAHSWLHPWTAEVSYTEHRTTGIASRGTVKTISSDHIALVKSLRGVLVTRLESVSRLDERT